MRIAIDMVDVLEVNEGSGGEVMMIMEGPSAKSILEAFRQRERQHDDGQPKLMEDDD
jgi:hypothetical protein